MHHITSVSVCVCGVCVCVCVCRAHVMNKKHTVFNKLCGYSSKIKEKTKNKHYATNTECPAVMSSLS